MASRTPSVFSERLDRVEAISFDLDDTLWDFRLAVDGAEQALHDWLLVHAPGTGGILQGRATLRSLRRAVEHDRPDLSGQLEQLRRESIRRLLLQADESPSLVDAAYATFFAARQRVKLFGDVVPALTFLSARYTVVAVTNGNANLAAVGIAHYFKACMTASSFGAAKPASRIFHAAASAAGVHPSRVLHIGDDWELDVQGAMAAGLRAAWLARPGTQHHTLQKQVSGTVLCIHTLDEIIPYLNRDRQCV